MADELVHAHTEAGVTTVTLDSPHNRNALSRRLVTELLAALDTVEADQSVRVVVIAAAGPVFCSGADLTEAANGGMTEGARGLVAVQRRILSLPVPVVVRLHGPARAGGLGIVGAADVVLAAETVTFAFTEVRLGLAPAAISLTTLPRMGDRAAALAYLSGEPFDASEAVRLGLVTRAVAPADLDASVGTVVSSLLQGSPQGLRETKMLLTAPLLEEIDRRGEDLAAQSARLFASPEARAAMKAFLAGRR
jgi:enoyl-CoA hydratase